LYLPPYDEDPGGIDGDEDLIEILGVVRYDSFGDAVKLYIMRKLT